MEKTQSSGERALVKAAFFGDVGPAGETVELVYGAGRLDKIRRRTQVYPTLITSRNIGTCLADLNDLEVVFSTWGMLPLTGAQLDRLPNLRAVFYAGGSVRHFALPLLARGIIVSNGVSANAIPVAEFTVAQILLSNKGYWRNLREYGAPGGASEPFVGAGNYRQTVSLLGAGQIGRKTIELLSPFHLRVAVFDPFLSEGDAAALGVDKVELLQAFAEGNVVSNHLADIPETRGLLTREHFSVMPPDATFINTGRGGTVNHDDLVPVFRSRPDLTALLDVTDPDEPLPARSPLRALPNIFITSHIAGSKRNEVGRVADMAIEEFERWSRGEPLCYSVNLEIFARSA